MTTKEINTDAQDRISGASSRRLDEILELRREIMRQWFTNHAEHCGAVVPPWPHEGDCQWPIPPVILATSPNEVYLLLLEVSGESFGLLL